MESLFPVFVLERDSGEIVTFDSIFEMQHQLERIDVENNEYAAWDRHGNPLELGVQAPLWLTVKHTNTRTAATALSDALNSYAKSLGLQITITPDLLGAYEAIQASKKRRKV